MVKKNSTTEEDDLLDAMSDPFSDEEWGLLDTMKEEDDAEGWVPEKPGDGIEGKVLKLGSTHSDYNDDPVPVVYIQLRDGTKRRIIGYSTLLRREIIDNDPQPGDLIAVRYWGPKTSRRGKGSGNPYEHYQVDVRRSKDIALTK